jgi:NAD(P)-dependent dehydrogenase (short-subunit alcohol dehydrogenase family)
MTSPILVTGGTGTLGCLVFARLRDAGCDVRVLSRRSRADKDGVQFVTGDLATGEGIRLVVVASAGSPDTPDVREMLALHARAAGTSPEEYLADSGSETLLGRLPKLAEVADVATIMASDRASAMTGTIANVTCGSVVD